MVIILVHLSCYIKILLTGWLEQPTFPPQFWRLEVQDSIPNMDLIANFQVVTFVFSVFTWLRERTLVLSSFSCKDTNPIIGVIPS